MRMDFKGDCVEVYLPSKALETNEQRKDFAKAVESLVYSVLPEYGVLVNFCSEELEIVFKNNSGETNGQP